MNIQRATPFNELLAKLLFLILPTTVVCYFLIWNANQYLGIIGDPHSGLFAFLPAINNLTIQLSLFAAAGMLISALFYSLRFRFIPTFVILVFGLYTIYKGLDQFAIGEFDGFFIPIQFLTFSVLFTAGWLVGWGYIRLRYWSVVIATILLCTCILLIAKAKTDTVFMLMKSFSPALLFAVYIVFTSEQIYSYKDKSQKFWWFLSRRLFLFSLLSALLLLGVYYQMRKEIKETVDNYGGAGKEGKNSMLNKNKDGTFDLKNYSRLQGSLGRNNDLLFCAHIDNFFPNTDIPNPLYLTAFYYTKFDTLTETFERDSLIPKNDLFEPDPSKLPLFFTKTDSSVIKNSMGDKLRKTVEVEVYSKELSPKTYLAPNTGFFVQPITVEKDFREEFKTAFRAKSYVSELNSAYFIYNAQDNKDLKRFQEQRFDVLRKVTDYSRMDKDFMRYYTFMPGDAKFNNISQLAHKVTANASTPVDKILAIRDWFLSKDETGEPLFKYTDNPGVPDIPSASKLSYFLFENHKGYCAYFAGATLFMLRSLGIPSRIAVGFLTVNRSDKNKGWYWYYADQAHAWVQVFFPGYGWLDFDTTVGNSDAQDSPKPDGTPPMQPPKAWLAADGIVSGVDTTHKILKLLISHMVFHDKEYNLKAPKEVSLDMKIASIKRDSIDVPLKAIDKGEHATAVSYALALKNIEPGSENGLSIIKKFPDPVPTDEVYLKRKDTSKPDEKPQAEIPDQPVPVGKIIKTIAFVAIGIVLILLLLPYLIYRYYLLRFNKAKLNAKAYWAYKTAGFYLHQIGIVRYDMTPMKYARDIVDAQFETNFTSFMNVYLKQKYSNTVLNKDEQKTVNQFLERFIRQLKAKTNWKKRWSGFLNPVRTISFFVAPTDNEIE